ELARHPHDPAGILDDEAHAFEQRVALEDHVRVDSADEAVANGVEARVHRIRLAAVCLVDEEKARVGGAAIHGPYLLAREHCAYEHLEGLELERLAKKP